MHYAVIEAPSNLGLMPNGVERLAEVLLANGLAERIGATRARRVEPLPFSGVRDPDSGGTLNADDIAAWSPRLADAVGSVIDDGAFPVVLGGDCSILLGSTLALKRRGRYGLLFIDGHADFFQPEAEPKGEVASMDLALATGQGPEKLTNLEGRTPLVRGEDVVAFGYRDHEDQRESGSQPVASDVLAIDIHGVHDLGIEEAVRQALARVTRPELEGFFIHFDADCLDDAIMPAVEYRIPGGLLRDDAVTVLSAAIASGRAVGIEVTIYNPNLDPDGRAGRLLTDLLVEALAAA
jgi:arginase